MRHMFGRRWGAAVRSITNMYSLLQTQSAAGGERLGEWTFCKTMEFAVRSTSDIHSLVLILSNDKQRQTQDSFSRFRLADDLIRLS